MNFLKSFNQKKKETKQNIIVKSIHSSLKKENVHKHKIST